MTETEQMQRRLLKWKIQTVLGYLWLLRRRALATRLEADQWHLILPRTNGIERAR